MSETISQPSSDASDAGQGIGEDEEAEGRVIGAFVVARQPAAASGVGEGALDVGRRGLLAQPPEEEPIGVIGDDGDGANDTRGVYKHPPLARPT